ncbi:MAG: hypothetical protein M1834_002962 [Cirrosporium novae-zelandiae]|nr:MAG: hypothetical protein M1834_002962 [Cirrosporium novae-zelandiae]
MAGQIVYMNNVERGDVLYLRKLQEVVLTGHIRDLFYDSGIEDLGMNHPCLIVDTNAVTGMVDILILTSFGGCGIETGWQSRAKYLVPTVGSKLHKPFSQHIQYQPTKLGWRPGYLQIDRMYRVRRELLRHYDANNAHERFSLTEASFEFVQRLVEKRGLQIEKPRKASYWFNESIGPLTTSSPYLPFLLNVVPFTRPALIPNILMGAHFNTLSTLLDLTNTAKAKRMSFARKKQRKPIVVPSPPEPGEEDGSPQVEDLTEEENREQEDSQESLEVEAQEEEGDEEDLDPSREPTRTSKKRRREEPSPGDNDDEYSSNDPEEEQEPPRKKPYASLVPRTRYVTKDIISRKWKALSEPACQKIGEVFKLAARPVVIGMRDEKRRAEAQTVVGMMEKRWGVPYRLRKKLPRMPFPPTTKDDHFSYEAILNANHSLESQLTPAIHSIALLHAEIEKEKRALEADRAVLLTLKQNAKREEAARRKQKGKHPLLQKMELEYPPPTSPSQPKLNFNLDETSPLPLSFLDDDPKTMDPALAPLVQQLQGHLHSLKNNMAQVAGVGDAMRRTRAAVEEVLWRGLDGGRYAKVLGGE